MVLGELQAGRCQDLRAQTTAQHSLPRGPQEPVSISHSISKRRNRQSEHMRQLNKAIHVSGLSKCRRDRVKIPDTSQCFCGSGNDLLVAKPSPQCLRCAVCPGGGPQGITIETDINSTAYQPSDLLKGRLMFLLLNFLICEMVMIITPSLQSYGESLMR